MKDGGGKRWEETTLRVIWRKWGGKADLRAGLLLEVAGPQGWHRRLGTTSSALALPSPSGSPGKPHLLSLHSGDPTFGNSQLSKICPLRHLFPPFDEHGFLHCRKILLSASSSCKTRKPRPSKIRSHNFPMPAVS